MIRYITGSLFYTKNRLFFENNLPVTKKNYWELNDYGWEEIDPKYNMNKYLGVLDCGGDGECLFKCIAEAVNNHKSNPDNFIDYIYLRKMISKNIDADLFEDYIENYKLQKTIGELNGFWDPNSINTIQDFKKIILDKDFWGDYLCLNILSKKMKTNFIVFDDEFKIILRQSDFNKTILLVCIDSLHFQLLSVFNGRKINTMINNKNIEKKYLKIKT